MVDAAFPRGSRLAFPRIWLAVPILLAVLVGGALLLRPSGGGSEAGHYEGNGVSFDYPKSLVYRGIAETPIFGDEHWVVSVGLRADLSSSVIVYGIDEVALASYTWNDDDMVDVIAELEASWDGGELLLPFTHMHVAGLQAIQYGYTVTAFTDELVRSIDTIVFDVVNQHLYRIQCQSVPDFQAQIDAACQQVLSTFKVE